MSNCLPDLTDSFCINCGWKKPERMKGWPRRNCNKSPDLTPGAERLGVSLADISHYTQAVARWTAAGFPTREQAEVERIAAELCRPCEHYRDGRCARCGCRVTQSGIPLANKIKMATESCPVGKWGSTATQSSDS